MGWFSCRPTELALASEIFSNVAMWTRAPICMAASRSVSCAHVVSSEYEHVCESLILEEEY